MNESPLLVKTTHTFQSALRMLSADHLNIDDAPFPVKCVRKFRSALGGEVTYRRVYTNCLHMYTCFDTAVNKLGKRVPYIDKVQNIKEFFCKTLKIIVVLSSIMVGISVCQRGRPGFDFLPGRIATAIIFMENFP